jgi:hypothetical protein
LQPVASPHGPGDGGDQGEHPARDPNVAGQSTRSTNRIAEIWDRPTTPAADLVAEQAQPAEVPAPDGARANHASACLVSVRRRRELDRVATSGQLDDEHCVVEVASWPMPARGCDGLEDPPVEADETTARSERNPIQRYG